MTDEQFKELQETLAIIRSNQRTLINNLIIAENNLTARIEALHSDVRVSISNTQLLLHRQDEQTAEILRIKRAVNS